MSSVRSLSGVVGVIGDVHAEDARLERALAYLDERKVNATLCVGDIVDGHGSASRACEILADREIPTVRGNHDRWLISGATRVIPEATPPESLSPAAWEFLRALPVTIEFSSPLGPLLLCHGVLSNDMARVKPDDEGYALESNTDLQTAIREARYPLVVNGHSHRRMVRRFGTVTIVNAGTLKREYSPCITLIDFEEALVEFVPFDTEGAVAPAATRTFELVPSAW
jgi:predicted phosphodiesterase